MKFWWANKVYNPQVTLAASLGFRIWQPLPMFTSWFFHDILWNKVQLCLQIGYTVILHSLSWFLCKDNFLDLKKKKKKNISCHFYAKTYGIETSYYY